MDQEKLQELEMGSDVTVITTGDFQLVDVATGIRIPPKTECTLPLNGFVMDQLVMGNLTLSGEDDAPEAEGDPINDIEELRYAGSRVGGDRSSPTEDAFAGYSAPRGDEGKSEVSTGARSGGSEEGASKADSKAETESKPAKASKSSKSDSKSE